MTLTYKDILDSIPEFKELSSIPMPAATAFKIMNIMCQIDQINEKFNQVRASLAAKYSEPDNNEILQTKINELLLAKVDVNIEKITINDLNNVIITPKQAFTLAQFMK